MILLKRINSRKQIFNVPTKNRIIFSTYLPSNSIL